MSEAGGRTVLATVHTHDHAVACTEVCPGYARLQVEKMLATGPVEISQPVGVPGVAVLRVPYAFGNVHQPGTDKARHKTINAILNAAKGGVATFNEAGKDGGYIPAAAHARGMSAVVHGELGIAWDDRYVKVAQFYWPISPGGHVGADGTREGPDNRRIGPGRGVLLVVLWDTITRVVFWRATSHDLARAGTVHTWRQPLLRRGWAITGAHLQSVVDDVPVGSIDGDKNWPLPVDYPSLAEVHVTTPATFGRNHYDQIHTVGAARFAQQPKAVNTPSDHHMLVGVLVITAVPTQTRPVVDVDAKGTPVVIHTDPVTPTPKPRRNPFGGAPVAHPWAVRSKRWIRRHPRIYRAILRWRRAHPNTRPGRR